MGKLANIARNVVGVGGEYISLNDLIANYPDGVTVNGVSIRKTSKGDVPCFTFAEDSNKYAYAVSGDLAVIWEAWLNDADGSIEELNNALQVENVKIKIQKKRTKKGNTYTKAWVVGTIEKERIEVDEDSTEIVDEETGEVIVDGVPF
jgi:hypothetical protein